MPTVESNKRYWSEKYQWADAGEEWSRPWGDSRMLWYSVLAPRIERYLPTGTVLEIAPGYGRCTEYLRRSADHLVLVDLNENCIEACRRRFEADTHLSYHVNDGSSLDFVEDGSVDFAFSFDSLVHVEGEVMRTYLTGLERKLAPDGVAFLHHSNLGGYSPLARRAMRRFGGRDRGVSGALIEQICDEVGLHLRAQELITWPDVSRVFLSDCFSLVAKQREQETQRVTSRWFGTDAKHAASVSAVY